MNMQLSSHEVHVWIIDLSITAAQKKQKYVILSNDEQKRADRFYAPLHQKRFIAAHAALRQILGQYMQTAPNDIVFDYTKHQKPFLSINPSHLAFNLAHSESLAVCAITLNHAIGIDIEKIKTKFPQAVAKRYFSQKENNHLRQQKNKKDKIRAFFDLWSRKEALVKAVGKGLTLPLSSFSVSLDNKLEVILLEQQSWYVMPLDIHSDYKASLA